MVNRRGHSEHLPESRRPPGTTPEERENQLVSLAFDLVEQRIRNGTATSQETTHFLKLGSEREKLERRRIEASVRLDEAKITRMESEAANEELYAEALKAMSAYSGNGTPDDLD